MFYHQMLATILSQSTVRRHIENRSPGGKRKKVYIDFEKYHISRALVLKNTNIFRPITGHHQCLKKQK